MKKCGNEFDAASERASMDEQKALFGLRAFVRGDLDLKRCSYSIAAFVGLYFVQWGSSWIVRTLFVWGLLPYILLLKEGRGCFSPSTWVVDR